MDSPRTILFVALALGLSAPVAPAAPVDFLTDIAPILEANCAECHNQNLHKGDVSLATPADFTGETEGLESVITPGHPDKSPLLEAISGPDPDMPKKKDPLTGAQVETIRQWIAEGASWPDKFVLREPSAADKSWWSLQPLRGWKMEDGRWEIGQNPIDSFIEEKLAEKGLTMNPPADARALIRRITYDLTGLPPSPEEIEAFVRASKIGNRKSEIENLINRLLQSSHYGERWGRHWLDVVRFGESNGFERNKLIENIWPFRDYVIRSLNEDKPFNQFIIEHLAGDVVGRDNPDIEVGTAFLVAGTWDDVGNKDPKQKNIIRANTLDDPITATGAAFLGLTVNCAKCHDHKFDPIQQNDYYRIRAAFEGIDQAARVLATPEARKAHTAKTKPLTAKQNALKQQIAAVEKDIIARAKADPDKYLPPVTRPKVSRTLTEDRFEPVTAKFVRLAALTNDTDPAKPGGIRLDEFEVWTAGKDPRNVALKSNGGVATAQSRLVEDSADNAKNAYGPGLVNDGKFSRRWFSAGDHTLTIELAKPARIDRVIYSSDRPGDLPTHAKMVFVGEYRLETSPDGENWITISESWDREPINPKFLDQRYLRFATSDDETTQLDRLRKKLAKTNAALSKIPPLQSVWAGKFTQPEAPTRLALGGDPNKPAEPIVPASLSVLDQTVPEYALTHDTPEAERRHALAKWIVHPDNPLTPRVLANRVWHYHFGAGIVNTPSDFGYMGGKPSHSELLDYLAQRLIHHGWRLKPLHREIMLSKAYQQSATYNEDAAAIDSNARLLWRFPPRRLSAEEVRDTLLTIAGKLDTTMGGPGFRLYKFTQDNVCTYHPLDKHGPETWRRAVYHTNARAAKLDLLTEFDCPDFATATPRRASTTTPLQALTLMNHSFTVDMAGFFAERVQATSGDIPGQVETAFEIAYGRGPSGEERRAAIGLIRKHGLRAFARALFNSNELIYLN